MNKRNMNSVIRKKINEWLSTIEDEQVRQLASKNTIVTGGAIVSMITREEVKDFDLYFRDKSTTVAIANYYAAKFNETHNSRVTVNLDDPTRVKLLIKSAGVAGEIPEDSPQTDDVYDVLEEGTEAEEKPKYRPVFISSNAITLSNKIQLVVRFYGEPEEIHKNYDFVHCTSYWTSWAEEVVLNPAALESILNKELRYMGSRYPVCSIIRARKFIARGWTINAGQYLKMIFQCGELDLTDVKVLEDQLIGVDSAYFTTLIEALKAKQESTPDFRVNSGYLAELINRIF